ncbi:MAG TPA: TonB-dependent receptor, partial [candidate division Zixibacteria bacterium]|nr:TonB-dependent receptor [candidate division Zixibacteria bacterium]
AAPLSLASGLDGAAGLDVRTQGGFGALATVSNWGAFNRHLLLLYNGRPVKDYSLGGFNLAEFSPSELSRIEIVKGPQSAFYGSDAVGGVVNLIAPTALADRLEAHTTVGSFGARGVAARAARRLGALGIGAWTDYTAADNRRPNSGVERLIAGARADLLSGAHRLALAARYFRDSLGAPGPVPDPSFIPVYGDPESSSLTDRQEDEHYSVDLQYSLVDERAGETQIGLFWEKKKLTYRSLYNYLLFSATTDSVDVRTETVYDKRSAGANLRHRHNFGPLAAAGGVDWLSGSLQYANAERSEAAAIDGPGAPAVSSYDTFASYDAGQDQVDLWGNAQMGRAGRVHVDLGGRLQLVAGRRPQPSYNLGLVAEPGDALRLKLAYAYAFRLPSLAEQFADDLYTAGNADLSPETARTLAATMALEPAALPVRLSLTWFRQEIDSLIQYVWDPASYRSVPQNFLRFISQGLDATCTIALRRGLSWRGSAVYQAAEQTAADGRTMREAPYVPEWKWRVGMTWRSGRFDAAARLDGTSERVLYLYGGAPKTIDPVVEAAAELGVRLSAMLRMHISGEDLTDRRRPDQFGFTAGDGDYPGLGRRFFVELALAMR